MTTVFKKKLGFFFLCFPFYICMELGIVDFLIIQKTAKVNENMLTSIS